VPGMLRLNRDKPSADSHLIREGARGRRTVDTFSTWETKCLPVLQSLVTALNQCDRTYERRWAPALLSHADQLRAASVEVQRWSTEHPCPLVQFDAQIARISLACAYAGTSFESVAEGGSSVTWLVVHQELRHLHIVLTKLLVMLDEKAGHLS